MSINESVTLDTRQAESSLRRLALEAKAAAGSLGVSGVGGAVGQVSGSLLALTGAGGPLGAVAIGMGVAAGGAASMVRALFDLTRTASANAKEMEKLGLVTAAEAKAATEAGAAVKRQDDASRALGVTIAASLSPAVKELSGLMTDGTLALQGYARWLGDDSTSGSVAWAAVKAVTGLQSVQTTMEIVRSLVPRRAADRSGAVAADEAQRAAEAAALAAAEKELLAARIAGASVDERERLQTSAKTAEIVALTAVVKDETKATWERERASTLLAAREEELRQIRASAERERAAQAEAERKRLESEADSTRRLAEARVALMAPNSGAQLAARLGGSNVGALATQIGALSGANSGRDPGLVAADTSTAGSANAGAADGGNSALVASHKAAGAAIRQVWTQTASTVASALDSMAGIFAKSTAAQKAFALTSIAINTAVATMQALMSPPGPPYTIPLAVAVGAFGAVQFAAAAGGRLAGGAGISAGLGAGFSRADIRDARRERNIATRERLGRNPSRYDNDAPEGSANTARHTTIYALDTRELVRQLREMGALGYAVGG